MEGPSPSINDLEGERPARPLSARALAIQILARVRATDAYLNVVLDRQLSEFPPTDSREAALATELCYGTSRRQLTLDHAIAQFSQRRLETLEDPVLAALRVGAYQLFYLRTPARAAVSATVEAIKELGLQRAVGFVNAILRRVAELEGPPLPPEDDPIQHLSIRESHPSWLVARWIRHFGRERAEQMLVANNLAAPLTIRVNQTRTTRDSLLHELSEAGIALRPTRFSPQGLILLGAGRVEDVLGYDEGLWQVQDEAAQLVVAYAQLPEGSRVLDACAAPGGKACHLAERVDVVASDIHRAKLAKVEVEARRLGVLARIKLIAHDATLPFPDELGEFDAVVVDAPCTGLGTLRRHPELRYRRQAADVGRLAELQRRILENAQQRVPPGGLLVYAVCSTEPEEGQDQIEMFLRSHPDFTLEPPTFPEGAEPPLTQGALRTLPGPDGMDGFFAARLRRMY